MPSREITLFKKFFKVLEVKRMNKLIEITNFSNYKKNLDILTIRMIKTVYKIKKTLISNNPLFYTNQQTKEQNTNVDKRIIMVFLARTTQNISIINKLLEKYKDGDYVIVVANEQGIIKKFSRQLKTMNDKKIKINIARSTIYQPTYTFAIFLERIIRQMILIDKKVGSAYLIAATKMATNFIRIAPLYNSDAEIFEEIVHGPIEEEDFIENFNLSPQNWLNFSITKIIILKILLNLLSVDILEKNNELITINQNLDILEQKINELVWHDLKERKKSMLDEDSILNG